MVTTGREFVPAAAMPSFISTSTALDGKKHKRRKNKRTKDKEGLGRTKDKKILTFRASLETQIPKLMTG